MAWNSETIDNVLSLGDSMYLNALQNRLIPIDDYQGTLSVTNLPNIVRFPNNLIAHSLATNNWSINNNNLPIVLEPIDAENNLPMVVEPPSPLRHKVTKVKAKFGLTMEKNFKVY